ncbi:MAG: hypothetical protein IT182_03785 [Acidobacteria bacterium]|nr:hypothetical protein [Acidobacteriota bacterium]
MSPYSPDLFEAFVRAGRQGLSVAEIVAIGGLVDGLRLPGHVVDYDARRERFILRRPPSPFTRGLALGLGLGIRLGIGGTSWPS